MPAPIYLDHLSTTPLDPRVLDAMLPYLRERFGHPAARSHAYGWEAEQAVEAARAKVADLVGADPREIVFTSGGTEADNLAILGAFEAAASRRGADAGAPPHIVTTAVEQRSVLDPIRRLATRRGAEVTEVRPDATGRVRAADVAAALRPETILVAVQAANAEIGTLQPVAEVAAACGATSPPYGAATVLADFSPRDTPERRPAVHFHCDATYAAPWIPLDMPKDGVHTLSFTAHRMGGPKGAGALYVRRRDPRVRLEPLLFGGGHERGLRPGTPDVAAIVGFGVAAEIVRRERDAEATRVAALRDRLESAILERVPGVARYGDPAHRLPCVTTLTFEGVEAEALLMGMPDVAASSGAGCTSATLEPSHVMRAIGVPDALGNQSLRFSLGRTTTADEIERVIARVTDAVERLRSIGLRR